MKSEQERLGEELEYIESRLSAMELKFDTVERNLKAALVVRDQPACRIRRCFELT